MLFGRGRGKVMFGIMFLNKEKYIKKREIVAGCRSLDQAAEKK